MESLLTSTAEILVIGFALLMALDFFSGLVQLYRNTSSQTEPQAESEQAIIAQPKPKQEPQPQPLSLVITSRDVFEFVDFEPATLDWLSTAQAMTDDDTTQNQPNIINMARARQQHLVFGSESSMDYNRLGIRELKKLASSRKIKRYNVMTKTQLIDQLTALDQLSA